MFNIIIILEIKQNGMIIMRINSYGHRPLRSQGLDHALWRQNLAVLPL